MIVLIHNETECIAKLPLSEDAILSTRTATKLGYQIKQFETEHEAELFILQEGLKRSFEQEPDPDEIHEAIYQVPSYAKKVAIPPHGDIPRKACLTQKLNINTTDEVVTVHLYIEHEGYPELNRYKDVYARADDYVNENLDTSYDLLIGILEEHGLTAALSAGIHLAVSDGTIDKIYN